MSPKIKVFLIYGISFMLVFLITRFILVQFYPEPSMWLTFIPLGVGMVLAPKPHIEETQSGRQYGLKSIFFKRIIHIK
ncbi:hypothetical protein AAU57_02415 [Nonlabens sp. YIK11]|uniref:hypothetical protein n=1 Tax=Nonlabens sp. YIK11 TaxID=1453349 RepID=UPI0006DC1592|nr:hypothetical protein [Nonlabens sp. YIK11]KQC32306.1 hypothetical protein AAU57_02415 [Nonlabens sp. YIK11]